MVKPHSTTRAGLRLREDANERRVISVRPGLGATALLRHPGRIFARNLRIAEPTLIMVLRGRKRLDLPTGSQEARAGDVVMLAAGVRVGLTNIPAPQGGYEAISIMFASVPTEPSVAAMTRQVPDAVVFARPPDGFRAAALRAREALLDVIGMPDAIVPHQLSELLLWLGQAGWRLPPPTPLSTADRLRVHIQATLDETWPTSRAAAALAMSEATLRRRLAGERETLSGVLRETRLTAAMSMLQGTDEPVIQVALACGFPNHSSFSRQFRERFAITPTDVRAAEAKVSTDI